MQHKTAIVETTKVGPNTKIWAYTHIREGAIIGNNCIIGEGVYIDHDIVIGNNVKIQNRAQIYFRTIIENNVFIGPGVIFTNDKYPRSTFNGKLLRNNEWDPGVIIVKEGASICTGAIIMPNIEIGEYSMVGAMSLVTKSIKDGMLAYGNPARSICKMCRCGLPYSKCKSRGSIGHSS